MLIQMTLFVWLLLRCFHHVNLRFLFLWFSPPHLPLTLFLTPVQQCSLNPKRRYLIETSIYRCRFQCLSLSSCYLAGGCLCCQLLQRKLLWQRLSMVFISEYSNCHVKSTYCFLFVGGVFVCFVMVIFGFSSHTQDRISGFSFLVTQAVSGIHLIEWTLSHVGYWLFTFTSFGLPLH